MYLGLVQGTRDKRDIPRYYYNCEYRQKWVNQYKNMKTLELSSWSPVPLIDLQESDLSTSQLTNLLDCNLQFATCNLQLAT